MITVTNKKSGGKGEYIGRPSPLGNPFRIKGNGGREEVIRKYREWLMWKIGCANEPIILELCRLYEIWQREGKLTLVCWCAPKACHGDVIKEILEKWND